MSGSAASLGDAQAHPADLRGAEEVDLLAANGSAFAQFAPLPIAEAFHHILADAFAFAVVLHDDGVIDERGLGQGEFHRAAALVFDLRDGLAEAALDLPAERLVELQVAVGDQPVGVGRGVEQQHAAAAGGLVVDVHQLLEALAFLLVGGGPEPVVVVERRVRFQRRPGVAVGIAVRGGGDAGLEVFAQERIPRRVGQLCRSRCRASGWWPAALGRSRRPRRVA